LRGECEPDTALPECREQLKRGRFQARQAQREYFFLDQPVVASGDRFCRFSKRVADTNPVDEELQRLADEAQVFLVGEDGGRHQASRGQAVSRLESTSTPSRSKITASIRGNTGMVIARASTLDLDVHQLAATPRATASARTRFRLIPSMAASIAAW